MQDDNTDMDGFSPDITSDRAGAISILALFEGWFSDEIRKCLVALSKTQDDRIFGDRGPLATLSAKIDFGFALGLYGPETKAILHNVRRIRNCFAHCHDAEDFTHPRVQALCLSISARRDRDGVIHDDPRTKYNDALVRIMFALHSAGQARGENRPSAPPNLP